MAAKTLTPVRSACGERIFLFALRAQVYRCRDCKKRFWVGVEWGKVILVTLSAVFVTGVAAPADA